MALDNAKFHHIVMGRSKTELQELLLKLGPAAYRLASEFALLDEVGQVAPVAEQEDDDIITIMKVTGAK